MSSNDRSKLMTTLFNQYNSFIDTVSDLKNGISHFLTPRPSHFEIWQVDESKPEDPVVGCLASLPGRVILFPRSEKFVEVAFNPNETYTITHEDLIKNNNLPEGFSPHVIIIINIEINGEKVTTLLHEAMEPVRFTPDHKIIMQHVEATNLVGSDDLMMFCRNAKRIDQI